jgi:CHAT domain-containing protein/tetratricopeptide (TPR) repeat protein
MALLMVLALVAGASCGQEPEVTPEQEKLAKAADALQAEAMRLTQQAKYAEATQRLRQAVDLMQRAYPKDRYAHGHLRLANTVTTLGFVLQLQGEVSEAEPLFRQALAMVEAHYPSSRFPQGHAHLAGCLNNVGFVLHVQGDYVQAEPYYRRALEMNRLLYPSTRYPQGHPLLATSLNNLGGLFSIKGEHARAESLYGQSLAMCRTLYPKARYPMGHEDLAGTLQNLANVFYTQGKYAKAEPLVREALEMCGTLYPKEKFPQGHPGSAAALNSLGSVLRAQGDYVKAEPYLQQAVEMCEALFPRARYPRGHLLLITCLRNLGGLLGDLGNYAKGEPYGREALRLAQASFPRDQYPQGHQELANSFIRLGSLLHYRHEYAQAEPLFREALEMHTRLASRLAHDAPEPVALNAAATAPLVRDALLSVTSHLAEADGRAYDAVWPTRAALTRVYQRRHLAVIAAATDSAVRAAWDELQGLRRQREQLIMAPMPRDRTGRAQKLGTIEQKIDAAEQALLPHLPAVKHYENLARLGPQALRQRLPAKTVVIDLVRYVQFDNDLERPGKQGESRTVRYLAFLVSPNEVRRVELGPAAPVDLAVRQWRESITGRPPAGNNLARREHEAKLARHAAALRQLIWEPIEKRLPQGTATLYLVPDGELTQLPWAALPGKSQDRILLEDYTVAVLPHAAFLLEQWTPGPARLAKRPPAPEGLLVVGGLHYDDKPTTAVEARRGADTVVEQTVRWSYLEGTEVERRLLVKLLQGGGPKVTTNLGGADAATARLRQELEHCRYAHLATHGFFADAKFRSILQLDPKLFDRMMSSEGHVVERIGAGARSPLVLSGLVCSGANRPETPERGILSGDAIAGLLLDDLHLAVLSACDTGLGDVAGGEGVFGLQRAFHIAGCKNVVASLWKVPDRPTAALMALFYKNLWDKKQPPIEALRQAQLEIYRHPERIGTLTADLRGTFTEVPGSGAEMPTGPGGTAHPRIWAAFTLSGAGK